MAFSEERIFLFLFA